MKLIAQIVNFALHVLNSLLQDLFLLLENIDISKRLRMSSLDLLDLSDGTFSLLSLCFILLQLPFHVLYLLLVCTLLVFIPGCKLFLIHIEPLLSIIHLLPLLRA